MRTRSALVFTICLLGCSGAVFAQVDDPFGGVADPFSPAKAKPKDHAGEKKDLPPLKEAAAAALRAATNSEQRVRAALSEESTVEFIEVPLDEALQELSQQHDIPIVLDRRSLEEVGLAGEEPVTISLKDVTLRALLRLMLHELDLTYIIKDEVMQVTTYEAAEQNRMLTVYVIPDALAGKEEQVLAALTDTVQPQAWSENGGPCSVSLVEHVLVVSATARVHEDIVEFLEKLRAAFEQPAEK